jgi:Raf kinase inhibitor-like YbhB/YbcL family protein
MTIQLTSSAFAQGRPIPKKYTGEGADVSPPLSWSGAPEGAKELVLICDDPDAPTKEPWVHWVIYKIPATAKGLPEGIPRKPRLKDPPGALQGSNSWLDGDTTGYRGPMPPPGHGVHHYYFKLYALKAHLAVESGLTKKAILQEIGDHVLAEGVLMGTYER